ncbi:MAG: hypothetical protein P4L99_15930 [Chthoniobacter sp.]|nr:hypothetical protein [Chthoniobacter sp.]
MNTRIHKPEWQRIEIWLLWAAILAAILLVFAPRASDFDLGTSISATEIRLPAPESVPRSDRLPFTASEVVQYFSTVLEMSAEKGPGGTMVFENHQATVAEDRWHIAISVERKSVVIEFVVGGDFGMTLAREFFESPLFERGESEQLYEMLGRAQNSPVKRLSRFKVGMTYNQTTEQQQLVLRFTAPNAA